MGNEEAASPYTLQEATENLEKVRQDLSDIKKKLRRIKHAKAQAPTPRRGDGRLALEKKLREEFEALKLTIDDRVIYPTPPQLEGGERKTEEQKPSSRTKVPYGSMQQQSPEPQVSPVGGEKTIYVRDGKTLRKLGQRPTVKETKDWIVALQARLDTPGLLVAMDDLLTACNQELETQVVEWTKETPAGDTVGAVAHLADIYNVSAERNFQSELGTLKRDPKADLAKWYGELVRFKGQWERNEPSTYSEKAVINQFIQGITPVALKANLILAHKRDDCFQELTQALKRARLEEEHLTLLDEAQEETEQLNAMSYKGAQLPHPHVSIDIFRYYLHRRPRLRVVNLDAHVNFTCWRKDATTELRAPKGSP